MKNYHLILLWHANRFSQGMPSIFFHLYNLLHQHIHDKSKAFPENLGLKATLLILQNISVLLSLTQGIM